MASLAAAVERLDGPRRDAAERMITALAELLDQH
jgi:hypothetical protein